MNYLKFNNLPEKIQERILKRQSGEGEGFAFKTGGIGFPLILTAVAFVCFGLLFYLANDYLWGKFQIIVFSLISLGASYFLLQSVFQLLRWFASRSKRYLLITPLYIIDIYFNDIWFWNLEQLAAVNVDHVYQNGRYEFTNIKLNLENASKTITIRDRETAEQTVEQINYYRKLFIEAAVRNDETYLDSNDDFLEIRGQINETNKTSENNNLKRIVIAPIAALVAAAVMFGAFSLNNYYDDKKSWADAQNINRASSYRSYLQTHPQGRWSSDANQKLQALYNEAAQKYQASLNQGYDQKAADAVLEVLKYAAATNNYRVKVVFERHNEIPANIAEELKEEFEVNKILSLDDTFSDEKMSRRVGTLLAVIVDTFRQIIPDDILEISKECSGECAVFLVKYTTNKGSLYYDTRQENVPESERTFYPGIHIDWDFGVKIPNQSQNYNFTLTSAPAEEISYDTTVAETEEANKDFTKVLNADKNNIYDSMVSSAFNDFRENLISRIGIGAPAKTAPVDTANTEEVPAAKKAKTK